MGLCTCSTEEQPQQPTHGVKPHEMHPASSLTSLSLDIVVSVGSATQVEADEDEAAAYQEHTEEDVDEGGDPEGKQVERPVTVRIRSCCVLVEVWFVNRVDPHITWTEKKPRKTSDSHLHFG